jgi:hypothetical protein
MSSSLQYHKSVQRWIPATAALFGLIAFCALTVSASHAQNNSAAASSGGAHFSGAPSGGANFSAHTGFAPPTGPVHPPTGPVNPPTNPFPHVPGTHNPGEHHHHNQNSGSVYGYPYLYGYGVPYAVPYDSYQGPETDTEDDSDYQGGPTVFDRRGLGADSYVPPDQDALPAHAGNTPAEPESPPDPTTLVFKDGHTLQVGNYAIVGQTLYDLTPGHARKVALADLDLPATTKQNDDRGITFQLPPGVLAN